MKTEALLKTKKETPTTLLEHAEEIYAVVTFSQEAGERGEAILYLLRLLNYFATSDTLKNLPKI